MTTTKDKIKEAVTQSALEAIETFEREGCKIYNDMIPCVYVQHLSSRKFHVGWRFCDIDTKVGDIQIFETGETFIIKWVYKLD